MKKQLSAMTTLALLVLLSMTAMAATGRYDQQIQQAVSHKIHDAKQLQTVSSSVEDGIVTLTGTVNLYQDKLDAAKKIKKLANVTGVRNDIVVAGETVPEDNLSRNWQRSWPMTAWILRQHVQLSRPRRERRRGHAQGRYGVAMCRRFGARIVARRPASKML